MEIVDDGKIVIDIDWVMVNYSREELLSALGFDTPSDYLAEVTISDALGYFTESSIVEAIDISDYWDAEDACTRYGTELLDYFGSYSNTEDWGAADHIDNYGDSEYMLEVLLENYLDVKMLHSVIAAVLHVDSIKDLLGLFGAPVNAKHSILEGLLKANYMALKGVK